MDLVTVPVERMVRMVTEGVAESRLPATGATDRMIRAHLRGGGVRCTIGQAREVLARLHPPAGEAGDDAPGETLGARLARARRGKHLTMARLAAVVGCSTSYLSYLESGERRPSDRLLVALAAALDTEPEWLRTGEESHVTRHIADLIRFTFHALGLDRRAERRDVAEARRCLELLRGDLGRPLRPQEAELVAFADAFAHWHSSPDRSARAYEIIIPVVRRMESGTGSLPERYHPTAAMLLLNCARDLAPERPERVREAVTTVTRILEGITDPEDQWWRVAATAVMAEWSSGNEHGAALQGHLWLHRIEERQGTLAGSGAASLIWNLGCFDLENGRLEESLAKLERALEWHDSDRFRIDGACLQVEYARVLVRTRPDRAEEALQRIARASEVLDRFGDDTDRRDRDLARAEAELAAGRPQECRRSLLAVLDSPSTDPSLRFEALLLSSDLDTATGDVTAAHATHREAAAALVDPRNSRHQPGRMRQARRWHRLADRFRRSGHLEEALAAYREALGAAGLAGPGWEPGTPCRADAATTWSSTS